MDIGLSNDFFLAAIDANEEKIASHTHERIVSEYIKLAGYTRKLQDIIISMGIDLEYVSRLLEEIEELKKKRPGGKQVVYTTKEKDRVLDMRKNGAVMREISEATGISMSTVKRILYTETETKNRAKEKK